ncbi:MAG: UDP-N-acetylmuramate dehydrogenase [Nitrospiria bacterium]
MKNFSLSAPGGEELRAVKAALAEMRGEVHLHEPMGRHTSMKIGGPADALVVPRDLEDLRRLVLGVRKEGIPLFLLGGTNLIVKDGGIRGIVVKLNRLQKVTRISQISSPASDGPPPIIEEGLYAEAGISFPKLSQHALKLGLSGLEFACGIPGTLGGAIVMNAGTHEGEIGDVLEALRLMDFEGHVKDHPKGELEFSYRRSRLPLGIIVGAFLKLKGAPRDEIRARMDFSLNHRRKTQPLHLPNSGCIFKNPSGDSAGRLIDELRLKGHRVGDAEVSERHANFIVNRGRATAVDVLSLIREIRQRVKEEKGIEMDLEVMVVGEDLKS